MATTIRALYCSTSNPPSALACMARFISLALRLSAPYSGSQVCCQKDDNLLLLPWIDTRSHLGIQNQRNWGEASGVSPSWFSNHEVGTTLRKIKKLTIQTITIKGRERNKVKKIINIKTQK